MPTPSTTANTSRQPTIDTDQANARSLSFATAGWNDGITRSPWAHFYDQWPEAGQCNYEFGRLIAAQALAAGLPAQHWPQGATYPDSFVEANNSMLEAPGHECMLPASIRGPAFQAADAKRRALDFQTPEALAAELTAMARSHRRAIRPRRRGFPR